MAEQLRFFWHPPQSVSLMVFLSLAVFWVVGFGFLHPEDASAAQRHRIKFATLAPEGSTWMKVMRDFARVVKKKGATGTSLETLTGLRTHTVYQCLPILFSGLFAVAN